MARRSLPDRRPPARARRDRETGGAPGSAALPGPSEDVADRASRHGTIAPMGEKREKLRDVGLLLLRLGIGVGIATHGYAKLFTDRMPGFIDSVSKLGLPFGQPSTLAHLAAWSEFAGGLLLVAGLLTRVAALFIAGTMIVAFFVASSGQPFGERELAYVYLVAAGALLLTGPGRFSLDHAVELAVKHGGRG